MKKPPIIDSSNTYATDMTTETACSPLFFPRKTQTNWKPASITQKQPQVNHLTLMFIHSRPLPLRDSKPSTVTKLGSSAGMPAPPITLNRLLHSSQ